MVYTVGLIGGIACGKSTAIEFFKQHGISCINADHLAKSLLDKGTPCYEQLLEKLGVHYLNQAGQFDRQKLRALLLKDKHFKHYLESLLHPKIQTQMLDWQSKVSGPYCVMEIPLLQNKTSYHLDRVLCIQSQENTQILRLKQRHLNNDEIQGLLAIQIPLEKRQTLADDIIDNDESTGIFTQKLQLLHEKYLQLSLAKAQKTS